MTLDVAKKVGFFGFGIALTATSRRKGIEIV
jgi:hypothetical protein